MTTFAVFIGIAFVAGTYVLTDTIDSAFDEIFGDSVGNTDVVLSAKQPVTQDTGEVPSMPAETLAAVQGVDGVAEATGAIFTVGAFFDEQGDRIGQPFAPQFVSSITPPQFDSAEYEGRRPQGPDEAVMDAVAAENAELEIGDRFQISAALPAKTYELVGTVSLGDVSFGGTSIVVLTAQEAARITDRRGRFDWVYAIGQDGVSPAELKRRVAAAVPGNILVETADEYGERQASEIQDALSFIRIALLVFAGIALFVGAFLIFNTFSITVAQRVREFGLLRTFGASRRQILGSVVAEAVVVGLLGAVAGLFGGIAVAAGLGALFKAIGIELPNAGTVVLTRTVVISLVLGLGITLLSALAPAMRSTRVPPMAALAAGEIEEERRRPWIYNGLAVLLAVVGLGMVVYALFGDPGGAGPTAGMMGGGAVITVIAVSLFSSHLVRPLAAISGAPIQKLRGLPGRLARENSQRKPGRTAVTAAALMIGIAVVTFFSVFAAGISSTVASAIDNNFQGELVLTTDGFNTIPPRAAEVAEEVEGVQAVASVRFSQAEVEGHGRQAFTGLVPEKAVQTVSLDWVEGSDETLAGLDLQTVLISEAFADSSGIEMGDTVSVLTQTGETPELQVAGIYKDQAGAFGTAIINQDLIRERFGATVDMIDFIKVADGADVSAVQERLEQRLEEAFPIVVVLNQEEFKEQQQGQIAGILNLVYALVLLAIIVSLFGIANTLALSIHERTRELGMLRAIGMSRRQVRTMIRYEAVITALIGAVLGMALGVIFAALLAIPLADEGFSLSYPVGTLIIILILSGLAGVLAAIQPARRASRLDVLDALSYE